MTTSLTRLLVALAVAVGAVGDVPDGRFCGGVYVRRGQQGSEWPPPALVLFERPPHRELATAAGPCECDVAFEPPVAPCPIACRCGGGGAHGGGGGSCLGTGRCARRCTREAIVVTFQRGCAPESMDGVRARSGAGGRRGVGAALETAVAWDTAVGGVGVALDTAVAWDPAVDEPWRTLDDRPPVGALRRVFVSCAACGGVVAPGAARSGGGGGPRTLLGAACGDDHGGDCFAVALPGSCVRGHDRRATAGIPAAPVVVGAYAAGAGGRVPTLGGTVVVLGANFRANASVFVGTGAPAPCSMLSPAVLACAVGPGVGVNVSLRVDCGGAPSDALVSTLRFAPPVLLRTVLSADGIVTLLGAGFGPARAIAGVGGDSVGLSGAAGTPAAAVAVPGCRAVNDSAVACPVPAGGVGGPLQWDVTIGGQRACRGGVCASPPVLESVAAVGAPALPCAGGAVAVIGQYLDSGCDALALGGFVVTPSVVVELPLVVCTLVSNSSALCPAPAGFGTDVRWQLWRGGEPSNVLVGGAVYAAPVVLQVTVGVSGGALPTTGGASVTVRGTGFGRGHEFIVATLGGVVVPLSGWACSELNFTSPAVEGAGAPLVVGVAGQASAPYVVAVQRPVVAFLVQLNASHAAPGSPFLLHVGGAGFGSGAATNVTIGGAPCAVTQASQTDVYCVTPSLGGTVGLLVVTVAGFASAPVPLNVTDLGLAPDIAAYSIAGGAPACAGGTAVILAGSHLGGAALQVLDAAGAVVGAAACTVLVGGGAACSVPAGTGAGLRFQGVAGGVRFGRPTAASFSYAPPSLSGAIPALLRPSGDVLVLYGSNFGVGGPGAVNRSVVVGGVPCALLRANDSVLEGAVAGVGAGLDVVVTVASLAFAAPGLVSFAPPHVSFVTPALVSTLGGDRVIVHGALFGTGACVARVSMRFRARAGPRGVGVLLYSIVMLIRIWLCSFGCARAGTPIVALGGAPCAVQTFNDSAIECTTSAGQGAGAVLLVRQAGARGRTWTGAGVLSYLPPVVLGVAPAAGAGVRPSVGGFAVTVSGTGFSAAVPSVSIGGLACQGVSVLAAGTVVTCVAPAWAGGCRPTLVVNASGLLSVPWPFYFDGPVIGRVTPNVLDAVNGDPIVLHGTNFAVAVGGAAAVSVRIGSLPCVDVQVMADGSLTCVVPPGQVVARGAGVVVNISDCVTSPPVGVDFLCPEGYYAPVNARCAACPVGAVCGGGVGVPYARAGFFEASPTPPTFVACRPAAACKGGASGTCAAGYEGYACGVCVGSYYRLDAACAPCPRDAWLRFLYAGIIVAVVIAVGAWLSTKQITLTGVTIGVEFLQILAMFSSLQFAWPPVVVSLLSAVSIANFNVQVGGWVGGGCIGLCLLLCGV